MRKGKLKKTVAWALVLATVMTTVLSPVTGFAADSTKNDEKPPLLEEVKNQLDADEIVKAGDLELEVGADFNVKKDFFELEIPDEEKVKITFEEAKNADGKDFSTEEADTFKAVYYVEPLTTDHPEYQISRKLIVKNSSDKTNGTESEAAKTDDESTGTGSDSVDNNSESVETESETSKTETATNATESEIIETETGTTETETGTTVTETGTTATETRTTETETETIEDSDAHQVTINAAASLDVALDHSDGLYDAGETVTVTTSLGNSLAAISAINVETNAEDNDLVVSDATNEGNGTYTFEMPDEDVLLLVANNYSIGISLMSAATADDDDWDDQTDVEAGSFYYFSDGQFHEFDSVMGSGGNDSYKFVRYKVDGKTYTVYGYCIQSQYGTPTSGTTFKSAVDLDEKGDDVYLRKALFYGYGGPGWGDTFNDKNIKSIMDSYGCPANERRTMQHYLLEYLYDDSTSVGGSLSTTAKNMLSAIKTALKAMPDPISCELKPGLSTETDSKKTETFTWKANEAFVLTVHLEDGVSLVNETTGTTKTGNVTVKGGQKFHLIATTDDTSSLSGSYKLTCNYPLDFHGMALKTKNAQDIGFGYYTNSDDLKLTVDWPDECTVSIVKKDKNGNEAVKGAIYGIYSDKACTKLITKMPATDANGASSVQFSKTQDVVYLKEISVPNGYVLDTTAHNVTLKAGGTTKVNVTDERVSVTINLVKKDKDTGITAQGDATLKGAVYGVYAAEAISHPDGTTGVLYKKDAKVGTITTNASGKGSLTDLYPGKYYVKELTAPTGYVLDETSYPVDCTATDSDVKTIERTVTSKEEVISQPFQILKVGGTTETDAKPLENAGFSAWLVSSLKTNADGSYDFTSADPVVITTDGKTEMFTDKDGYAVSAALPYGRYIVRETTTPHNYSPVNDFYVDITENKPTTPQAWRVLLDKEFEAKLKVIKKDGETGKNVLVSGAEFKIYDMTNEKYVEQVTTYPTKKTHKSYFTDEEGYLILPKSLKPGQYRIEEVTAPVGYTLNETPVEVTIDADTAYLEDPDSDDIIIEAEVEDQPVKGELSVYKKGEVLTGAEMNDEGATFTYEEKYLAGAEFEVYAAEDIYTADHQTDEDGNRTLVYAKDTLVTTLTTNADGLATVKDLPLGKYLVKETKAPEGYVLNGTSQEVELAYADQNTAVVKASATFTNDRQKPAIEAVKQDAEDESVVAGAVFGIYNQEDIMLSDGTVGVAADTLLQKVTTDEEGKAAFTTDLPLGAYYVKEVTAPAGYILSDEVLNFDASYQGQDIPTVSMSQILKNKPTTMEFTKSDLTTGKELPGAHLQVTDADGNVVDEWISTDEAHVIKKLEVGKTYTMTETKPADGYATAEAVTFTIEDTEEVQKVEMKDDVTKLKISKTDITGDTEVPGAKLTILDENDQVVESWISTAKPYYIEKLPIGTYTLREEQAPKGYTITSDVSFEVKDTGDVQTVVMKDDTAKGRLIINKTDADTGKPLKGVKFELRDANGKVLEKLVTDAAGHAESKLYEIATFKGGRYSKPIKYYLVETKALKGYNLDDDSVEVTFKYADQDTPVVEVTKNLKNKKTPEETQEQQETEEEQTISASLPKTGDSRNLWLPILLIVGAAGVMTGMIWSKKKGK